MKVLLGATVVLLAASFPFSFLRPVVAGLAVALVILSAERRSW